jgi:translocation and assembly module TamA
LNPVRLTLSAACLVLLSQTVAAQEVLIEVAGNDPAVQAMIRRDSLTFTLSDVAPGSAQDYVAAARSDYRRILTGLYSLAHYGGTISILLDGREAADVAPLDSPARIGTIRIIVDPGPLFTFGQTSVSPVPPGTILPTAFAAGQTASADVIETAVQAGVESWRDAGHAKAAPSAQQITAQHTNDELDVAVTLDPGPRLTFGNVVVTGNTDVRTERILAIAGFPSGQVFSPATIENTAARLRRTEAFSSVAVIPSEDIGPGNTLDYEIQVSEMLPRRIGFGAEISSLDGLSLTAFWKHRNLLGGAETLEFDFEATGLGSWSLDGIDLLLEATFGRPSTFRADLDFEIAGVIARLDEPDFLLEFVGAGVGFTRFATPQLTYEAQIFIVTARQTTILGQVDYTLFTLPLQATLDRRDNPFNATSGYYLDLEATPFTAFGASSNGSRFYADARYYQPLGSRLTLAARGQFGSLVGASVVDAPSDFLFYSGGSDTVRGWPYNSLGVTTEVDLDGETVAFASGGASLAGAQLEARFNVTDNIGVVGFYDFAYVDAEPYPTQDAGFQAGTGIGARYNTPVGPIRVDLATPASGSRAFKSLEFYIGVGQAF